MSKKSDAKLVKEVLAERGIDVPTKREARIGAMIDKALAARSQPAAVQPQQPAVAQQPVEPPVAAAQSVERKVASASHAPSANQGRMSLPQSIDGPYIDLWNLSAQQVDQLGVHGVRAEFEKILDAARVAHGAPRRPTIPQGASDRGTYGRGGSGY